MELALSLGGDASRPFTFLNRKTTSTSPTTTITTGSGVGVGGGRSTNGIGGNSYMGLGLGLCGKSSPAVDVEEERESDTSHSNNSEELDHGNKEISRGKEDTDDDDDYEEEEDDGEKRDCCSSSSEQHHNSVVQLNLLPFDRVSRCPSHQRSKSNHHQLGRLRFPWVVSAENVSSEPGSSDFFARFPEPINRVGPLDYTAATGDDRQSSPNSAAASPSVEFSLYPSSSTTAAGISFMSNNKRPRSITIPSSVDGMLMISNSTTNAATLPVEGCSDPTRSGSRGSDDDENGSTRKKLRLSKEQSAFLEESFKEHHTLNPKQKQALAKQLNLRPRQVEVWFQNRRARTKLKQTEVDCEYLKRWCETLTEENKRLQKEVHELRALNKSSSQPFYMNLPPTTLTMCPSCERVATTGSGINNNINNPVSVSSAVVTVAAVPTSQINLNTVAAAATTTLSSSATCIIPPTTDLTLAKPTSSPPQMQAQTQGSGPEG